LHCLIIGGDVHIVEEEILAFYKVTWASKVYRQNQLPAIITCSAFITFMQLSEERGKFGADEWYSNDQQEHQMKPP
jgi:hypothetical protein